MNNFKTKRVLLPCITAFDKPGNQKLLKFAKVREIKKPLIAKRFFIKTKLIRSCKQYADQDGLRCLLSYHHQLSLLRWYPGISALH